MPTAADDVLLRRLTRDPVGSGADVFEDIGRKQGRVIGPGAGSERFPPGFAANDPRIPETKKLNLGKLLRNAGKLLRVSPGDLILGIAEIIIDREISDRKFYREQSRKQLTERKRRAEQEKRLRAIKLRHRVAGLPAGQTSGAPGSPQAVPVPGEAPSVPSVPGSVPIPEPDIEPIAIPEPVAVPDIFPDVGPVIAPGTAPQTAPAPAPVLLPAPAVGLPTGGFGVPQTAQQAFPSFFTATPSAPATPGINFRRIVRKRLTRLQEQVVDFEVGKIELPSPQAVPQTDPAKRRCKPCKEDNPKPREKCMKGIYYEGPLDTDVDFREWAEVDCQTGRELPKRSNVIDFPSRG